MAKPSGKLAESLETLHELQAHGTVAIRSADLSRTHRERLLCNGFLQEVIKGWYVPTRPDETVGNTDAQGCVYVVQAADESGGGQEKRGGQIYRWFCGVARREYS